MKLRISTLELAIMAVLVAPHSAPAADGAHQTSRLISTQRLLELLTDPKVRLLDARPKALYEQGHIPGAVWVDTRTFERLGRAEAAQDEAAWAQVLSPLGIAEDTRAVYVYDSARQRDAAPIWWALSYAGVPRVGLVDGGFGLWLRERRPVSSDPTVVVARAFKPSWRSERLASRDDLKREVSSGDAQIVDARPAEEFRGERAGNATAAPDRIPGASNLDAYRLVDAEGRFVDKQDLTRLVREAGLAPGRPVIVYSNHADRSAIVLFALERLALTVRNFVPGLSDRTSDPNASITAAQTPENSGGRGR